MKLTISAKKIWGRIRDILMVVVFFVVVVSFYPPFNGKWMAFALILAIGIVPNIILLVQYLIANLKISSVEFGDSGLSIQFKKDANSHRYNYSDIRLIEVYRAAGMDKGNYSFNPVEKYYFARIITKDKSTIILTSLLGPDLSDALAMAANVPVDRTKTPFASIFSFY